MSGGATLVLRLHRSLPGESGLLEPAEGSVVAAEIGIAEGLRIRRKWTQTGIVAGGVAELAVVLRTIATVIGEVAGAVIGAGTEAILLCNLNQGRNLRSALVRIGRWRRGRRWRVVGLAGTAGDGDYGGGKSGEEKTFHGRGGSLSGARSMRRLSCWGKRQVVGNVAEKEVAVPRADFCAFRTFHCVLHILHGARAGLLILNP